MATRGERLTQLANHLENVVTDEQFDMNTFVSGGEDYNEAFKNLRQHKCGTTGCIAGHAIALFDVGYVNSIWLGQHAGALLGLSMREHAELFTDYKLTRFTAAEELRRLAAIDPDKYIEDNLETWRSAIND